MNKNNRMNKHVSWNSTSIVVYIIFKASSNFCHRNQTLFLKKQKTQI